MNRLAFVTAKVTFRFFILSLLLGGLFSPQVAPGQSSYNWSGLLSTDWNTAGNWGATGIAPTGTTTAIGSIYVTNRANNALFYTAADGTTIFTSGARCFRIADGAAGALYITGGTLNCIGTGDLIGNGASAVGLLQIDGGTYISTNGNLILGGTSSTGTFTINSGTAVVATVQSGVNAVGQTSTINLTGGLLQLKSLTFGVAGTIIFNLSNGTLQAAANIANWLTSSSGATYNVSGPVIFDTQAFNITNAAVVNGEVLTI